MKHLFRSPSGSIRNGWWILAFIAVFLASQPAYRLVSRTLKQQGIDGLVLSPLPFLFLMAVTWICLRVRGQSITDVKKGVGFICSVVRN